MRLDSKLVEQKLSQDRTNLNKQSSKKSEISLNRSSSGEISSHDSFMHESDGKRGMYKISKEMFDQHKQDLIREEQYALVRQESLIGLQFTQIESETHRSVANRVFKNHDIASARASHASAIAEATIQQQQTQISEAKKIASGFQDEVDRMNKEMIERLETMKAKERERQRREEENERRKLQKEERIRKIMEARNAKYDKHRRAIKQASTNVAKKSFKGLFTTQMSNAAYERSMSNAAFER